MKKVNVITVIKVENNILIIQIQKSKNYKIKI